MSDDDGLQSLQRYLTEQYQMPTDAWWVNADANFEVLRASFEQHSLTDVMPYTEADEPATGKLSPSKARLQAAPVVTLLKTGSHLARLSALSNELSCIAFGTISSSLFVDVFWDTVSRMQMEYGSEVQVFEASDPSRDLFRLSLGGYKFRIFYFHCHDLLRLYPNVGDAPHTIVRDLDIDAATKSALATYFESKTSAVFFHNHNMRVAYYAIRAWALERFCFSDAMSPPAGLTPKMIVERLREEWHMKKEATSYDCKDVLRGWLWKVAHSPSVSPVSAGQISSDRETLHTSIDIAKLLAKLNKQSIYQRLNYPGYLVIGLVWFGGSMLKGGRWLKIMDRRVKQLRNRYHRQSNSTYEGFYILGLSVLSSMEDKTAILTKAVDTWVDRTLGDDQSYAGNGFIHTAYKSPSEMEIERFTICHQEWPEEARTNPHTDYSEQSALHSKHAKSGLRSNNKKDSPSKHFQGRPLESATTFREQEIEETSSKAPRFRPASDVINRLKHDDNYSIDEWVVGYLDRHADEPQEKPAANWQAETTHDEFIPEHRIVYFKRFRNGEAQKLWDKPRRVDLIFGSKN